MIEVQLQLKRGGFVLDVALQLPPTGITALFGPSGCGKTTLLRALAGLERGAGRVAFVAGAATECWQDDALRIWTPTHLRPLGYVIQEAALFPHLTVQGNLAYATRRAPPSLRLAGAAMDALIDMLGIGALMARRPDTLSGGERQRVAIARALATAPRLLLMDEPLASLDAARKADILPYLERLHRNLQLPIIYVTHALDEVARLADHLVLMQAGRVLANGPLHELLSKPDLPLGPQDEAGVVIETTLLEHDASYGLLRLGFAGGSVWAGQKDSSASLPIGSAMRVRVLARDVSITRQAPAHSSVLNVLPVVLEDGQVQGHTAVLRLKLPGGPHHLLARITRRSLDTLALMPGEALFAQIKGVALM